MRPRQRGPLLRVGARAELIEQHEAVRAHLSQHPDDVGQCAEKRRLALLDRLLVPDIDEYLRYTLITEVSAAGMKSPDCAITSANDVFSRRSCRRLFGPCDELHPERLAHVVRQRHILRLVRARVARLDEPDQCDG